MGKMRFLYVFILAFFIFVQEMNALDAALEVGITLKWENVDNVSKYEVIVEQKTDEKYIQIIDEIKSGSEIYCRLVPGFYRYKVIVYDILGRVSTNSDWFEFEVKQKVVKEEGKPKFKFSTEFVYDFSFIFITGTGYGTLAAFTPVSAGGRLTAYLPKINSGNIGFEFNPTFKGMSFDLDASNLKANIFGFTFNLLYQIILNEKMFLNFRGGIGLEVFYDFYFINNDSNSASEPVNIVTPLFLAAASYKRYFKNFVYIDVGIEYKIAIFGNSVFHFLSPVVSIGALL